MHIALDGSLLGARFSGVERSVAQLVRALARVAPPEFAFTLFVGRAFDAYVAAFHPDGFDPTGRVRIVQTGIDNADRLARSAWQQVALPRLVDSVGADLFHGPAYISPVAMRVPHVVTVYDLTSIERPEFTGRLNHLHFSWLVPAGMRRAQRVVVPSVAAAWAVAKLVPASYAATTVIPLGVEARFFSATAQDVAQVRERYRLPACYCLWVGNLEPKKNVLVLLDALKQLRDEGRKPPRLVLAGALSWGTNAAMQAFLKHNLQADVMFLGRVDDAELPALYRGASGFVFPSVAEGFGLPVLEAMAAGTPVAASTAGSLPEVLGDAGLAVPPFDTTGWARAMIRLTTPGDEREAWIAQGLRRAKEFSWDKCAERTLAVYAEVTEQVYN